MNKTLSTTDVRTITGENNPVIKYPDLQKYNTIDEIFNEMNSDNFILLYETALNFGHWCCCFRLPNGDIEFYDSYGGVPDKRLKMMKNYYDEIQGDGSDRVYYPHLSKLLLNSKKDSKIHYNQYQHQEFSPSIATCGRHVGNRLLHRFLNIDEYSKIFGKNKSDRVITNFTNNFLV